MRHIRCQIAASILFGASLVSPPAFAATSCGGEPDDTACLQRMFAAGGDILLPIDGIYHVTKALQIGSNTMLNGRGSTISSTLPIGILAVRGTGTTIRNLKIESLATTSARDRVAIMVAPGTSGLLLQGNRISGYFGTGIMIAGGRQHDIKIVKNTLDPENGKMGYGILVNAVNLGDDPATYPHDILVLSNTVTNVSSDAVEINSPVGKRAGYPASISRVVIQNNVLSAPNSIQAVAGFCIGIAGAYRVKISGNQMSDCKWQGVHIEDKSSQIDVLNNTIRRTIGPTGAQSAWKNYSSGIFSLNSNNLRILGNAISGTRNNGIEMGYNPGGMNTSVTIAGNTVANAGGAGIVFSGQPNANVDSMIGAAEGYPANTIRNSGSADIVGCVSLRGNQGIRARCGR